MRVLLRFLIGLLFLILFIATLLLSAVKFKLLREEFWDVLLQKSSIYQEVVVQVQAQVASMRKQLNSELVKLPRAQRKQAEERLSFLAAMEKSSSSLTVDDVQRLIETNVRRLLTFLNTDQKELLLYLPLADYGINPKTFGPPFSLMSENTDIKVVAVLFGANPEATAKSAVAIQQGAHQLVQAWAVGMIVLVLLLAAFFALGKNLASKVHKTALLLLVSGLVTFTISSMLPPVISSAMANAANLPSFVAALIPAAVNALFAGGTTLGGILAVVGVVGAVLPLPSGKK